MSLDALYGEILQTPDIFGPGLILYSQETEYIWGEHDGASELSGKVNYFRQLRD